MHYLLSFSLTSLLYTVLYIHFCPRSLRHATPTPTPTAPPLPLLLLPPTHSRPFPPFEAARAG